MKLIPVKFYVIDQIAEENTVSSLGRLVMLVWLFLLLVITSSYTANLSSILTIEQLSEPIKGIESLAKSDWSIGYQVGSFSYRYLLDSLHVQKSRLVPLASPEEYERALRRGPDNGGVAAIVDEIPYVEEFLKKQTDFGIIGQPFAKSGWGFVSILLLKKTINLFNVEFRDEVRLYIQKRRNTIDKNLERGNPYVDKH